MTNTPEKKNPTSKFVFPAVIAISLLAILFLFWLIYFHDSAQNQAHWVAFLPYVNASLNALSALFLVLGFIAITRDQQHRHKKFMGAAFIASCLFLVSYITYHSLHGDTRFLAQGLIRPIYFFTLISHILLSILALPMVLLTFFFSLSGRLNAHKKLARWTFPLWLYVSVSGVLIVFFLKVFNPVG